MQLPKDLWSGAGIIIAISVISIGVSWGVMSQKIAGMPTVHRVIELSDARCVKYCFSNTQGARLDERLKSIEKSCKKAAKFMERHDKRKAQISSDLLDIKHLLEKMIED